MTWLSWFFTFYPALLLTLAAGTVAAACATGRPGWLVGTLAVLYLVPLATYRLHERAFPLRRGQTLLLGGGYSPWWGGHQIQWIYVAFPPLEAALRAVPGLYSAWLRAWGSEIGAGVYWTPIVDVADRGLLRVGDRAVIGHRCTLAGHIIRPVDGDLKLTVRRAEVGPGAFLGALCNLAPGCVVGEAAVLSACCTLGPGARVGARSVLGNGCSLGVGARVGEDLELPAGTQVLPGARYRP